MREITAVAGLSTQYVPGEKVAGFQNAMAV
jgi:hypothetical protein